MFQKFLRWVLDWIYQWSDPDVKAEIDAFHMKQAADAEAVSIALASQAAVARQRQIVEADVILAQGTLKRLNADLLIASATIAATRDKLSKLTAQQEAIDAEFAQKKGAIDALTGAQAAEMELPK